VDSVADVQARRDPGEVGLGAEGVGHAQLAQRTDQGQVGGGVPLGQRQVYPRRAVAERGLACGGQRWAELGHAGGVTSGHDYPHPEFVAGIRQSDPLPTVAGRIADRVESLLHQPRWHLLAGRGGERTVHRGTFAELGQPRGFEVHGIGQHQHRLGVELVEQPGDPVARLPGHPGVDCLGGGGVLERHRGGTSTVLSGERLQESARDPPGVGPIDEQGIGERHDGLRRGLPGRRRARRRRDGTGGDQVRGECVQRGVR